MSLFYNFYSFINLFIHLLTYPLIISLCVSLYLRGIIVLIIILEEFIVKSVQSLL